MLVCVSVVSYFSHFPIFWENKCLLQAMLVTSLPLIITSILFFFKIFKWQIKITKCLLHKVNLHRTVLCYNIYIKTIFSEILAEYFNYKSNYLNIDIWKEWAYTNDFFSLNNFYYYFPFAFIVMNGKSYTKKVGSIKMILSGWLDWKF